ncbi:MAG: M3 family oligoendopeptidase [Phycisphaerales bacterium JB037]
MIRSRPVTLDATKWDAIEPVLDELRDRPVTSADELVRWLEDRSAFESAASEAQANLYIDMTRRTNDEAAQQAYASFVESIPPRLKPRLFELDRRTIELAGATPPERERYEVILRDTASEVDLFRDENIPIETELARLGQEFGQISGAMTVEYKGKERPLAQMAVFQESTDRKERESAWRAVADRRLQDADRLEGLFDKMVARRHALAQNAGFADYIGYAFKSKLRFDYTPADCRDFHDACAQVVVPFNRRLQSERERRLGLEALRPWDLAVDPKGRPPLRPFETGRELFDKTLACFEELDPRLASMFAELGDGLDETGRAERPTLDLESRKGKAPGGYQYMRDASQVPFIFMNAAGMQGDVRTMIHEAGHAFHSMVLRDEPLLHYRHAPIEFCEVASMAMEFLTMPHWGVFYDDPQDLARARREQIEGGVQILSWIATIDAFQHWIYAQPAHDHDARRAAWLELDDRFGYLGRFRPDFDGLNPDYRARAWQRQGHLFTSPFYYIEYGIAQLGALGLWIMSLEKSPADAIEAYLKGLQLGGSRPLPELFKACGLPFDFGPETVGRLVERAQQELDKLKD